MKRKHTALEYKNIIKQVRDIRPDISITSDFIIGYPGESEDCFQETLDLIEQVGFDDGYSFIYSKRPGTPASYEFDNITLEEKKNRLMKVQSLLRSNSEKYLSRLVDTTQEILVEGLSKSDNKKVFGRTQTNKLVNFVGSKELIGKTVQVHIKNANRTSLDGVL